MNASIAKILQLKSSRNEDIAFAWLISVAVCRRSTIMVKLVQRANVDFFRVNVESFNRMRITSWKYDISLSKEVGISRKVHDYWFQLRNHFHRILDGTKQFNWIYFILYKSSSHLLRLVPTIPCWFLQRMSFNDSMRIHVPKKSTHAMLWSVFRFIVNRDW